jgi:chromosome segregation ATPase
MAKRFTLLVVGILAPLLIYGIIYQFRKTASALADHKADLEREEVSLTRRRDEALKSLQDHARLEEAIKASNAENGKEIASLSEKVKALEEKIGDVNAIKNEVDRLKTELKEVREVFLKAFSGSAPLDSSGGKTNK